VIAVVFPAAFCVQGGPNPAAADQTTDAARGRKSLIDSRIGKAAFDEGLPVLSIPVRRSTMGLFACAIKSFPVLVALERATCARTGTLFDCQA
jgi:hypothetical protein